MTFAPRPPRRRRWFVLRSVFDAAEVLPGEFAGDVSGHSEPLRYHASRYMRSEQERVGKYVRVIQAQMKAADADLEEYRTYSGLPPTSHAPAVPPPMVAPTRRRDVLGGPGARRKGGRRAIANSSTFSSVHAGSTTGIWLSREGFELFVSHPESTGRRNRANIVKQPECKRRRAHEGPVTRAISVHMKTSSNAFSGDLGPSASNAFS
jgi:hypothetical protein